MATLNYVSQITMQILCMYVCMFVSFCHNANTKSYRSSVGLSLGRTSFVIALLELINLLDRHIALGHLTR